MNSWSKVCWKTSTILFCLPLLWLATGVADEPNPQEFFNQYCLDCHQSGSATAGVNLEDVGRLDWSQPHTSELMERAMKAMRDQRMPPEDAQSPPESERRATVDSLHSLLMRHSSGGGQMLRRLGRLEYENTVRDLFGIDFRIPVGFPADTKAHGFDNQATGLVMSGPLMESYYQAAIAIADAMLPPPAQPVEARITAIAATDLVISYSSGVVVDEAMRLAAKTDSMWRSCTWPEKFEVRQAGTYRLAVTASRFAPAQAVTPRLEGPMQLQLRARSLNGADAEAISKQRLLAEFEVTSDAPQVFECVAELYPSETPVIHFANALIDGDGAPAARESFGNFLREMFEADPRLLAGWLSVDHGPGLRGGVGWDRVRAIRDSETLDLAAVDMEANAVDGLIKKMAGNPQLYAETVVYQLFEEGPSLQVQGLDIEGPLQIIKTPEQLRQEKIARQFFGDRGDGDDVDYVRSFLSRFLTRAFRRPASTSDLDHYASLVLGHVDDGHDLDAGLHLAIRAVMMSPHVLYREHREGHLDDFDLAARLSYFLTGSPPDESLFATAEERRLSDPQVLKQHTLRLLESKRIGPFVTSFTGQWLATRELADMMADPRLFPQFTDQHQQAMVSETELFFTEILKDNLPLETFIRPDFTYVNQPLAKDIYGWTGLKLNGKDLSRVAIPEDSPHGGLLGMAGIMMATSNGVDTQPIVRGVWVLDNLLGDAPPEPPQNVPAITPDTSQTKSIRELISAHRADESCAACHRRIDPIGLVLENFDAVGRWRTEYAVLTVSDAGDTVQHERQTIDATAEFPGGIEFRDVNDLKTYLHDNIDQFAACLADKLLTYATGRPMSYADRQAIARMVVDVRQQGNGFRDLIVTLVQSDIFRVR